MPNIELHGFSKKGAEKLKEKIDRAMQAISLGEETITNICDTIAQSCNGTGKSMPFLRIFLTKNDNEELILKALRKAGVYEDTEIIPVKRFLSKKEIQGMRD